VKEHTPDEEGQNTNVVADMKKKKKTKKNIMKQVKKAMVKKNDKK